MQNPKITILLSTYNRAHLIPETLDSILAQTYKNWDCIIVDDRSTDNTEKVIENYIKKDNRFSFYLKLENQNMGLSASRNYGLELAKKHQPDFIQFFDDDDLMHPTKLELQLQSLQKNPEMSFCLCGSKSFQDIKQIDWKEKVDFHWNKKFSIGEAYLTGDIRFVAQVPLFRYAYVKEFHFDEDLFYAEEWTLFSMHFLLNNPQFTQLEKVLFYRRKHTESITESKDENFQKRKTSAITGVKILNFLNKNNIHTKVTLFYFSRQFLLYKYDSKLLGSLKNQFDKHPKTTNLDKMKFRSAWRLHFIARKIILKILNF